jgi:hypothetical protein
MTFYLDDIREVCGYESIGITQNGYVKIYELQSVNYVGIEPYESVLLDDEFILSLLKRYQKIYLYERSKEWFYKMPNYITHLILDFELYDNINLDKLHNGLRNLVIICTNDYDYNNKFNKSLENLPQSLETLEIISAQFNQPLDLLPISLKCLSIRSNNFNQSLSNLPSNLYYLLIDISDKYRNCTYLNDNLMNLPEGLKELSITSLKLHISENYNKTLDNNITIDKFTNIIKNRYNNLDVSIL